VIFIPLYLGGGWLVLEPLLLQPLATTHTASSKDPNTTK